MILRTLLCAFCVYFPDLKNLNVKVGVPALPMRGDAVAPSGENVKRLKYLAISTYYLRS